MPTSAKVYVYWNLHKHLWSIRYKGTVIAHAEALEVPNATFKVNEAGRKRVLKEGRKNVHAYAVAEHIHCTFNRKYTGKGDILPLCHVPDYKNAEENCRAWPRRAYYNPYTTRFFVDYDNSQKLDGEYCLSLHANSHVTYL